MAVTDGKTRKARRRQPDHPSPTPSEPTVDHQQDLDLSSQMNSAPAVETNSATLEESFQEIALADSGKVMLNVFDAGPTTAHSLGDSFSSVDFDGANVTIGTSEKINGIGNTEILLTQPAAPSSLAEFTGTKDLLFRLIQSDYFDAWIGLNYLWKYNGKDVGLQYFLCERLRERPMSEIEFVLPQICHLVVFNLIESTPLECFLLDVCQKSLHASIFTLWFLENYLVDIRETLGTRESALKFDRCSRLLQEIQLAIWGDMIRPAPLRRLSKEYAAADEELSDGGSDGQSGRGRGLDTLPGVEATLVGFGCALAAFASPKASQAMSPLVLMEARKKDRFRTAGRFKPIKTLPGLPQQQQQQAVRNQSGHPHSAVLVPMTNSFPSIEDLSQGRAFSFKDVIARTARQVKKTTVMAAAQTSKALGTSPPPNPLDNSDEWMPARFYHPEMQFVMGLIDISRRLCHVPGRDGRQQALQAELSLINHNLPASLCIPLWCHGTDLSGAKCTAHHRLLRIPAAESVILNSAERVPFVIYVEVVRDMIDDSAFERLRQTCHDDQGEDHEEHVISALASPAQIRTPRVRTASTHSSVLEKLEKTAMETDKHPSSSVMNSPIVALDQPVDKDGFAERMRTAAIMLAQLTRQATQPGCPASKLADINAIKAKLISEMEALEKSRLLDALQARNNGPAGLEETSGPLYSIAGSPVAVKDDPSAAVFRESWEDKRLRIKEESPYGHVPGWDLISVIVKSGADMRQEQLACQLIEEMHDIWNMAGLPIWVYPFRILVAAAEGGLVETVRNALSLHSIRKQAYSTRTPQQQALGEPFSLRDYYLRTFGSPDSDSFINARDAFMRSLAGYSLVTYILQLRDRHNGNILVDAQGHLIHIDFGFMLANAPGGYYGFESAPFKLSSEYIDLLGGLSGETFDTFKELMFQGFMALRKHADRLLLLLEITQKDSRLPCFGSSGPNTIAQLRQRFQLGLTETQVRLFVDRMITSSAYNVFTRLYDSFQYYSNGIL